MEQKVTKLIESSYRKKEPWVVVDPDFKREWVVPEPLRYYVVEDRKAGTWFICDRWTDVAVPETDGRTRTDAIRRFYKWCKREMPEGTSIAHTLAGVSHHGETG
jgi:hypothetical protein